jgi:hypothetical protein
MFIIFSLNFFFIALVNCLTLNFMRINVFMLYILLFLVLRKSPYLVHIKRFDIKKEFLFIPMFNPGCFYRYMILYDNCWAEEHALFHNYNKSDPSKIFIFLKMTLKKFLLKMTSRKNSSK